MTPFLRRSALLSFLLALAPAASAQQASLESYGSGCSPVGSSNEPDFVFPAPPVLGSAFEIRYDGPSPLSGGPFWRLWPWLVLGLDPLDIPLPASLFPAQPPGCRLLVDPAVIHPLPPANPGSTSIPDRLTVQIPPDPSMAGVRVRLQWWLLSDDLQGVQERRWILTSRGWIATLGN